jgi:hypothetical protein
MIVKPSPTTRIKPTNFSFSKAPMINKEAFKPLIKLGLSFK